MKDDLANRSLEIHWPNGFTPADADLFSHNELLINAPCERVWRHIVEATKWPQWYPNSSGVEILADGGSAGSTPGGAASVQNAQWEESSACPAGAGSGAAAACIRGATLPKQARRSLCGPFRSHNAGQQGVDDKRIRGDTADKAAP